MDTPKALRFGLTFLIPGLLLGLVWIQPLSARQPTPAELEAIRKETKVVFLNFLHIHRSRVTFDHQVGGWGYTEAVGHHRIRNRAKRKPTCPETKPFGTGPPYQVARSTDGYSGRSRTDGSQTGAQRYS